MNEDPIGRAMDVFLQYRLDDTQYPRCMGTKNGHAVKLQQHLHDQMLAQSEFCDVTLVTGDIVSVIFRSLEQSALGELL